MLDDLLVFAAETLVDGGRLAFWMPTANDEALELPVPSHPCLETVEVCTQVFNKCPPPLSSCRRAPRLTSAGSRKLITYRRIPDAQVDQPALAEALSRVPRDEGQSADELNPFRRGYFSKFVSPESPAPD